MTSLFKLTERVVVVTGATGALAGSAADYLAAEGARVVYLGRSQAKLDAALARCRLRTPTAQCLGLVADVLDQPALELAKDRVQEKWGRIDALINGAGGNMPGATISPGKLFEDLDFQSFQQMVDLNLHGTVLPSLVFVPAMVTGGRGQLVLNNMPFGRFGDAEELHGAIHYLLADSSKFVTGTILPIDGGFVATSGV
ncbi:MAG: hypothetical protein RLZZ245_56 [Verrucomicrobiota bacterium]|jgi:NAD(P)-dependent dehydrogenase (short-subunit alcohol dehydrogenase family)